MRLKAPLARQHPRPIYSIMATLQDLLFPRPTLAPVPVPTLQRWLEWLLPFLDDLPPLALTARERSDLGGYAFLEGTLLCMELERALRAEPALFPTLPGQADRLADLGPRAGLWLCLRDALLAAAARAEEQYLLARGARVGATLAIVRSGSGAAGPLSLDPQAEARRERLASARFVIRAWQDRIHRRRRRRL